MNWLFPLLFGLMLGSFVGAWAVLALMVKSVENGALKLVKKPEEGE